MSTSASRNTTSRSLPRWSGRWTQASTGPNTADCSPPSTSAGCDVLAVHAVAADDGGTLLLLVDLGGWPSIGRRHVDGAWMAPSIDVSCDFPPRRDRRRVVVAARVEQRGCGWPDRHSAIGVDRAWSPAGKRAESAAQPTSAAAGFVTDGCHRHDDSRARTRSFGRPMIAVSFVTTTGRCSNCL